MTSFEELLGTPPGAGTASGDLLRLATLACPSAARASCNADDSALVAMLGLLDSRIFEATGTDMPAWAKYTATGYNSSSAWARIVLIPL